MSFRPVLFHDLDDDGAPVDYTYVSSVNEGRRRQRAQSMHDQESPSAAVVRHQMCIRDRDWPRRKGAG